MSDGTRVLKTVAVPLAIALVFLFFIPKTCSKVIGSKKLRAPVAAASTAAATSLHIASESPDAPPSRPVTYPAGLDAQRVQYLIEINERFADPFGYRMPKPGAVIALVETAPADALVKAGWFEEAPAGGYTPTREAALHLPHMAEVTQTWRVPLGTRKFVGISSLEDKGDGRAHIAFTWQWEPNEAGRAIKSTFEMHQGTAEFAGGGEHPWDLNSVSVDSDWK